MAKACLVTFVFTLLSLSALLGTAESEDGRKAYIVHVLKSMKPQHFTSHHHWCASVLDQVVLSDPSVNEILYTYDTLLHDFAARLSKAEAQAMEVMDGCLDVIPSSLNKISTTRTPEFLGLSSSSGLWSRYSTYGKDIIVGMILREYGLKAKASKMKVWDPQLPLDGKARAKVGGALIPPTAMEKSFELDTSRKATNRRTRVRLTKLWNTNLPETTMGIVNI
ncbi:hypothetical protein SUGI_0573390 [Cryptomeria japonica]|nr:hypothetical protein SUGI_0573390 [Cryptomeria japonica]